MTIKELTTGQDSFLDITANLVGILIILVVLVGAQAKQNWTTNQQSVTQTSKEVERLRTRIERAKQSADKLTRDNHLLEQQIEKEAVFAQAVAKRRQRMLVNIELMKKSIEEKKSKLAQDQEVAFDKRVQMASLEQEIDNLRREKQAIQTSSVQTIETIEHYPTPIAKTVLTNEVHFRLANGKLTYVPMDELTAMMKSEMRGKAEKLRSAPTTMEMVGPISGFRMQYQLEAAEVERPTATGVTKNQVIRLNRFVLIPVQENGGESIAEALGNDSDFQKKIALGGEKNTTVSLWVYPNSFTHYNQVKDWLRSNGFQTACWPLAEGRLISGSPNGLKSSAQ